MWVDYVLCPFSAPILVNTKIRIFRGIHKNGLIEFYQHIATHPADGTAISDALGVSSVAVAGSHQSMARLFSITVAR